MKILALEASTAIGSIAFIDSECLRAELWFDDGRTHSERLLRDIDLLLQNSNVSVETTQGIAVGLGPGSFTGLRIALATAKGLALALDLPLAGIPTLEALAHNAALWRGEICALIDARRGHVYSARFRSDGMGKIRLVGEPAFRKLISWLGCVTKPTVFLGDGAEHYRGTIQERLGNMACFPPSELMHPRASVVARLGWARLREGRADDLDTLEPFYLRRSEAERRRAGGG
jgi:tRNA threonylcarbamoyladenosine biosynthesis protein TsaB